MKRQNLTLKRQTVLKLTSETLRKVGGGYTGFAPTKPTICSYSCNICPGESYSGYPCSEWDLC
jgi:hypothetical protein